MTRNARFRLLVLCVICLTLVPAVTVAQAVSLRAGPPAPGAPLRSDPDNRLLPSLMPPGLPNAIPVSPDVQAPPATANGTAANGPAVNGTAANGRSAGHFQDEGDWGRVVYQNYDRNIGQYDLFVMRDLRGAMNNKRLTNDKAIEFQPALSPDGTRIAFASAPLNKDNQYEDTEIYVASFNYLTATMGPPVRLTNNDTDEYWPVWSPDGQRLAFYRVLGQLPNRQMDIFVMNADGSGQTNITNHPRGDGFPTWSPDGQQIAFSSNRTGDYYIYAMNADGSNVRQLSNQRLSLRSAWSPDGTKIAYSADANGDSWWELMVMDADGQNQKALIASEPLFDIEVRSWAPNGKTITYTKPRYFEYQGQLYLMDATMWAYDYVGEPWENYNFQLGYGDAVFDPYWGTIDNQPPQTSMTALPAESPAFFTIRWGGADRGVAGLNTIDVQMQTNGGPWVDLEPYEGFASMDIEGVGGQQLAFRSRGRDFAGNVEPWPSAPNAKTMVENRPPVTTMRPLPAFSRVGEPVIISWTSQDPGGSNIKSEDFNFRLNNGVWTALGNFDFAHGVVFMPEEHGVQPGDKVGFRVRATDFALNVEPWPPDPGDGLTWFFTRRAVGRAVDNTGNPVGGATVAATPAGLAAVGTAVDGRFMLHMGALPPSLALQWAKAGYGALPPATRTTANDRGVSPVMPPAVDALVNGNFEAAGWGAWQPDGSIPPERLSGADQAHTGTAAAGLGERVATFGNPIRVKATPDVYENRPVVAVDGEGRAFVVWSSGDTNTLTSATRRPDGTWTGAGQLGSGLGDYKLTTAPDGQVWLTAVGQSVRLWRQSDEGWATGETIPDTAGVNQFSLIAGPGERLDFVWCSPDRTVYYMRRSGGVWSAKTRIGGGSPYMSWCDIQMATTPDGSVHLVWTEPAGDIDGGYNTLHRRRAPDGSWGAATTLFGDGFGSVNLMSDASGRVHLLWLNYRSNSYGNWTTWQYRSWSGGAWGPQETLRLNKNILSNSPAQASADGAVQVMMVEGGRQILLRREPDGWVTEESLPFDSGFNAAMTIDATGGTHFAYLANDSLGVSSLFYLTRSPGGDWVGPVNVAKAAGEAHVFWANPGLAVDAQGNPYAAWLQYGPGVGGGFTQPDVAFAGPVVAAADGESILLQTVAVPAGMANPTLSFVYQSRGTLRLELAEPDGTPLLAKELAPYPTGMSHEWLDMSAYKGQSVKVTFRLAQAADKPAGWATVDDVSLGRAYTDIAVWGESGRRRPDDTMIHTLTVANPGVVAAGGVELVYDLPSEMTFVSAQPAPAGTSPLRWTFASLAAGARQTITITLAVPRQGSPPWVSATADLTTADAELELLNNTATIKSQLEHTIGLPVVLRPDNN